MSEELRKKPHDETTADSGKAARDCWKAYMEPILSPVAECPARESYTVGKTLIVLENGEITDCLKFPDDGHDLLEGEISDVAALHLVKETFVSVKWLYEFKHMFLNFVESNESLFLWHVGTLFLLTALLVILIVRALV